jgi:dihydroorotase
MPQSYLLKDATLVSDGLTQVADLLIKGMRIEKIAPSITVDYSVLEVACNGAYLIPGIIDDQVHFRQPGFPHKGTIASESRAAIAGGTTSFMEMPNTNPATLSADLLEEKYAIASQISPANYSFYMGASNTNLAQVLAIDYSQVCGIKAFLGSSTGNMLLDSESAIEALFANAPCLVAIHAEDESTILAHTAQWAEIPERDLPSNIHPIIRDHQACYLSSAAAVARAQRLGTRLHVLHISTAIECSLFEPIVSESAPFPRISSEVCVHHLHFSDADYPALGNLIKCNPAIKTSSDRAALWSGLAQNRLHIIATDHAPHTLEEKQTGYRMAPSGLPLVQHSLQLMLSKVAEGLLTLPELVTYMCHRPAGCFNIEKRGYIREGYFADLVLLNHSPFAPSNSNGANLYQVGWSPLDLPLLPVPPESVWVSGHLAINKGTLNFAPGQRLTFSTLN